MEYPLDQTRPGSGRSDGEGAFARAFDRIIQSRPIAGNSVRLLKDAGENYPAWLKAIGEARQRVHFENYIVADDEVGRMFAAALIERARAGVTVRLLYDWLGSFGMASPAYWSRLRDAGVEVRCYNPPRLSEPFAWFHRDHRKGIAIDGHSGFVSGICISHEWLGEPEKGTAPWRDTGVAIEGPAVAAIDRAFADTWAESGGRIPAEDLAPAAEAASGTVPVRVLGESPGRFETYRVDQLIACIARRSLWLTDAYFVATPSYIRTLADAVADGVDVRLLVPGSSDVPTVQALTRAHYRPLLEAGIRVFEWNGTMLHAKTAVCDGRWARVGSTNLNLNSWMANYELDVLVEDPDFAQTMEATYLADLRNATEIVLEAGTLRSPTALPSDERRQSGARTLAASALSFGSRGGAALSGTRPLPHAERQVATLFGIVLLAAALITLLIPLVVIVPLAIVLTWSAGAMLVRAWRLRRAAPP